jgi:thiamine-phosphate pyrophosphorylase
MGDALIPSIAALPRGSGVIFRHYGTRERQAVFDQVRRLSRARRLVLVLAGPESAAQAWHADGSHSRSAHRPRRIRTAPVHTVAERIAAERAGANLLFVSPVFATQSHKGAKPLGRIQFGQLITGAKCPVIALGGMTARRFKTLQGFGVYGWAAIDGLMRIRP